MGLSIFVNSGAGFPHRHEDAPLHSLKKGDVDSKNLLYRAFMRQFLNTSNFSTQVKNAFVRWLIMATLVSALFSLTGFLGNFHRLLELTSHFKLQYLTFTCCALIFLILNRQKLLIVVSLFCIVLNLAVIVLWYGPQPRVTHLTSGEPIRILLANVLTSNRHYSELISLIQETNPDIAVFLEVNEVWSKQLAALQKTLQYYLVYPREDNFGIALYSKIPFKNPSTKFFGDEDVAS